MAITPAMFSSNMMIAKLADHLFPPVALAFWRWAVTLLLLLPFTALTLWAQRNDIAREWRDLLVLGALGMGVCGAFVYIGAETTSVTNIGLIYGASPVLIIVLARFIYGEAMSARQALGVVFALAGVIAIVTRADPTVLRHLTFTAGDLWSVAASAGWAVYSVMVQHRPTRLPPFSRCCQHCRRRADHGAVHAHRRRHARHADRELGSGGVDPVPGADPVHRLVPILRLHPAPARRQSRGAADVSGADIQRGDGGDHFGRKARDSPFPRRGAGPARDVAGDAPAGGVKSLAAP